MPQQECLLILTALFTFSNAHKCLEADLALQTALKATTGLVSTLPLPVLEQVIWPLKESDSHENLLGAFALIAHTALPSPIIKWSSNGS